MPAVTYVQNHTGVCTFKEELTRAGTVAVDCEAAGFHRYTDRLCLVQLSTVDETFVLDPLAVDLTPCLKSFLEDPNRRVTMHGAAYDLRLLRRDLDIAVTNLADTQVAASLLGESAVSLQALLERHLGVRVSKKFQRADWAKRPLPRQMIEYAADDTRHLLGLAARLEDELQRRGRADWAEEEYQWLVETSAEPAPIRNPDPLTRLKGARSLNPRDATALRKALEWRDRIARSRDLAPFRVVSDRTLLAVVLARPAAVPGLAQVKGFPRRLARTEGQSLLAVMKQSDPKPLGNLLPDSLSRWRGSRPAPIEEAAFERLKVARNKVAEKLGLERGRVMANHVLRKVVDAKPASLTALKAIPGVRRWQAQVLGERLLKAL